jgi:hypothetical protein
MLSHCSLDPNYGTVCEKFSIACQFNVNILEMFGSYLYNNSVWVNPSQRASLPLSFVPVSLHTVYFYVYISEMIVCHTIYYSVINVIRKRTVVFLWEQVGL